MRKLSLIVASIMIVLFGCEETVDTLAPEITISSPVTGSTVSKVILIKVLATDDQGVETVEFYIDGELLETVSEEPFETSWDTEGVENGDHSIQCKAIDAAGNESLSEQVIVTVANALFTAIFTDDWLCPDCGTGVLFVSDMEGNVLGEGSWTGNGEVVIESPGLAKTAVGLLSITTVTQSEWGSVYSRTNMNITPGETWTFRGYPDYNVDTGEYLEFNLSEIPTHDGWTLSTAYSSASAYDDSIPNPISLGTDGDLTSAYLHLKNTGSGSQYLWLENLTAGPLQLNLSSMSQGVAHTIQYPPGVDYAGRAYLYGFTTENEYYNGRYVLDRSRDFDWDNNTYTLYAPQGEMAEYRTYMYYDDGSAYFINTVYGSIPDQFNKLEASLEYLSATPDNFEISTSGIFDQIRSSWRYNTGETYLSWYVYGPADLYQYNLPELPGLVQQYFPDFNRNSFELNYTDLVDHTRLESYAEILQLLFYSNGYFYETVKDYAIYSKYYDSGTQVMHREIDMHELYYETLPKIFAK